MSKDYIRVSKKHGLNPTITLCFWCGENTGIALLGKLPNDAEAPKKAILNYEPCPKCKKLWEQGIPVLEVSKKPLNDAQAPICKNPLAYPTGTYAVVKPEALNGDYKIGKATLCYEQEFSKIFTNTDKNKEVK